MIIHGDIPETYTIINFKSAEDLANAAKTKAVIAARNEYGICIADASGYLVQSEASEVIYRSAPMPGYVSPLTNLQRGLVWVKPAVKPEIDAAKGVDLD